jgi:signal transduction histidine kinase
MFSQIRWRLVAWTMLVLALILLALGAAVYAASSRALLEQVDRNLVSRAEQVGPIFDTAERGMRGPREGYRGGVFYLAIGSDGQVLANPQQVNLTDLQLPTALRPGLLTTVTLDGDPARLLLRPLGPRGQRGWLVVGQSLAAEQGALNSLLLVLVAGGLVGLVLSFGGAWFLAGRALIPIEQAFRRQQEFVADASHELRTPLTVLRSATDLLNQHRAEPLEANGVLFDDIRADLARLERLAGDLLTLARSDRGELELAVAPLDLEVFVADVLRLTEPLARQRGVRLVLRPQSAAAVAEVDPDRLQQVLLILLDNAIKHTPAEGEVSVAVQRQGAEALIEMVDSGSGIAPEHLPRIFDRFYRADPARSRAEGGTGLGLAIARTLVEAHDGSLSLSSTPGVGTRVALKLPLAEDARQTGRLGELAARLTRGAAGPEPSPAPERSRAD